MSGSELIRAGQTIGLQTASEVFADRTYQQDGSLTSRLKEHAMIENDDDAVAQVIRMVKEGKVLSQQGTRCGFKGRYHLYSWGRSTCFNLCTSC